MYIDTLLQLATWIVITVMFFATVIWAAFNYKFIVAVYRLSELAKHCRCDDTTECWECYVCSNANASGFNNINDLFHIGNK